MTTQHSKCCVVSSIAFAICRRLPDVNIMVIRCTNDQLIIESSKAARTSQIFGSLNRITLRNELHLSCWNWPLSSWKVVGDEWTINFIAEKTSSSDVKPRTQSFLITFKWMERSEREVLNADKLESILKSDTIIEELLSWEANIVQLCSVFLRGCRKEIGFSGWKHDWHYLTTLLHHSTDGWI